MLQLLIQQGNDVQLSNACKSARCLLLTWSSQEGCAAIGEHARTFH